MSESEIAKEVRIIWKRLFDHTQFLNGERNLILNEFELKRKDKEITELFSIVENLADLRDTQVNKVHKLLDNNLVKLNQDLTESLALSTEVLNLEANFKENTTLDNSRKARKLIWDQFMNNITEKYTEINNSFEQAEIDLRDRYSSASKSVNDDIPAGIHAILKKDEKLPVSQADSTPKYLMTSNDYKRIPETFKEKLPVTNTNKKKTKPVNKLLYIQDLRWLLKHIQEENRKNDTKIYLHELMEGSEILLPENAEIPRNPELEKRCQRLRIQQENEKYKIMTKNVDNVRRKLPEDTIGYQMKEMNKQLIAVFQFIISVLAGFAFGFIGIEVFVGALDFGFRLLLGIIFALIVALAELYFLAKKLNEDYDDPPPIRKEKVKTS